MVTKKTEYGMPSSNGQDTVHIIEWKPDGEVKGILQISHGMIEYIDRYDRFARFMASKGFLVIGNDHLGHGETAADKNFGYFAPKDGSYYVVRDLHRVSRYIRKKYPDVPFFLLGHSMGSFMARCYAMMYGGELDGLILMGTGSKSQWLLNTAGVLVDLFSKWKGDRGHSRILDKLCFAMYNSHFTPVRTPSDWLTRNEDEVDAYRNHKYCQFTFTLNGYRTLFDVISYVQKKEHIHKIPRELPILFVSGDEDPVGAYGKGVKAVAGTYRKAGVKDVTCIMYPGARHELLNELEYEKTQQDMWEWLCKHQKNNG